ncbi:MAG: SDR family NAD(P)-dependent oxidoreductase [Legionellales bacterium]
MYVITGGGSGIGRALAQALAARGKSVLIVGRREQALQETAAGSSLIQCLSADIATADGLERIKNHLENVPQIHALVNNAGMIKPLTSLKNMQAECWHQIFHTNLDAALFLPQKLYAQLTHARVLNIGSGAAYFPIQGWGAYCVSKAALAMLTRCWQLESDSIAFASVMPGIIDTEMQAVARSGFNMEPGQAHFYQRLKEHKRLISIDTVAAFLTWLLLDIDNDTYVAQEWDIYDTKHHGAWLRPPHQVLHWDF